MSLHTTAKTRRDSADVMWCFSLFQTRAAVTRKARSPISRQPEELVSEVQWCRPTKSFDTSHNEIPH